MSGKARLFLDKSVVMELATVKWPGRPRGMDALVAEWAARFESEADFPGPRTRSTLYSWLSDGAPPETKSVLGLSAVLDVDPLTIFDFERNGYFKSFARLREQIYFHAVGGGRFRSVLDLMVPRQQWPNDGVAREYYRRPWFAHEFEHWPAEGRINEYADISIRFPESTRFEPRCVHMAYRRANSRDKLWRYYGTVQKFRGRTRLFSESGAYAEQVDHQPGENGFVFKTYFGATQVEFRVACLHAFTCETGFPASSDSDLLFEPDPRH